MTKSDLIQHVSSACDIPKTLADKAIGEVFSAITKDLQRGNKLVVPGFGTFTTNSRAARTGRNPGTGEAIQIKASTAVKFSPAQALKDAVNGGQVK